ncbi:MULTISPECIES: XdhC family protein [unclassified Rhizobium]|jgi:xanthine dehydrogenase accessory factor|uniref:XdhC family protein n=1 Tax=unclassified Rhizobium TaxID=2613769 RepID=UPI001610F8FF|nr:MULTISPECIES: XdhC family protein [unclassified Rhizobium]MBB3541882.1 xanthine dehydrogenase accessory factor [Rhizobium sp. BK399]MCS3740537.1 xanthine dehydrogenase accessory factor [Rhizobium sp. BK661]MCS4094459.1 xanthine dehydrogenase accessory factor [Rhizobium sp. BK176]
MDATNLGQLNDARRARRAAILLTDLETGDDSVVLEGDSVSPSFGLAIEAAFRSGRSTSIEADGRRYFLNVHLPPAHIVVIGAVHISQILAQMASLAGFDVRIIDPRTAFATPERFLGIDLTADWPVDALKERPLDAYTALVAVTHDPKIDDFPITEALRIGCFYVGALGSRKTHAARLGRLRAEGVDEAALARISGPIGLNIGAASPAEIAVAILAEIVHTLRTREISPTGDNK